MPNKENFIQKRYLQEENNYLKFTQGKENEKFSKSWLLKDTVDAWRHRRMYHLLDPILTTCPHSSWLTIGDGRYGKDAQYIKEFNLKVMSTDISDVLLKESKELGLIDDFSKQNAENLEFEDKQFDFAFCKESYHHFPRPIIALYEMLRVVKKGVILIEPADNYIFSTFIETFFHSLKKIIKIILSKKIVKYNFEETGNFVYTVSLREIEKVAIGNNYKTIAYKGINDCYVKGVEYEKAVPNNKLFRKIKGKILISNILSALNIVQYNLISIMIFKDILKHETKTMLKNNGFNIINLPENPYLK